MLKIETLLNEAHHNLDDVRDALAAVSAYSVSGSAKQLSGSSDVLQSAVRAAEGSSQRVIRLMRHLGVDSLPDASAVLCSSGRPEASRAMLSLHQSVSALATSRSGLDTFIAECVESISAALASIVQQTRGGRLLGSA